MFIKAFKMFKGILGIDESGIMYVAPYINKVCVRYFIFSTSHYIENPMPCAMNGTHYLRMTISERSGIASLKSQHNF